ncbi:MAG: alanine--tRNA ligase-related protein, partial [Patescibacteria group bacterium]
MDSSQIRSKFLEYFQSRDHVIVPSSSLIPNDPSVLLTTAGMQQFKPYYTGKADPMKDFGSKNTVSIQKSFRTSDIEEVGDERHLTFFEMLGNFSFGGYFKEEAITHAHEFITKEMGLPISFVTTFSAEGGSASGGEGSKMIPNDEESRKIWNALGITDVREEGMDDVFWGPTGSAGPCGPTTEIYCKNAAGQDIEVWNIVFNEFFCESSREDLLAGKVKLAKLPQNGIDTGMGLERLAMISQNTSTIFDTDLFLSLMQELPKDLDARKKRIITDHLRGSAFLIVDGVRPSNKQAGYILRRLLRRVLAYERTQAMSPQVFETILLKIINQYAEFYQELAKEKNIIINEYWMERERFGKTLNA